MSEPATSDRPFYVTGGTLKPGEPSYVERRADTELFESLLAGEFCYVLTARQMGKSSLMARTAKRLEQAGVASAIVDLTQIGSERGDQAAAQWYFGIANLIHRQLKIDAPLRPWWQERADLSSVQRLTDFFRELVLAHVPGRVVVFVDEIDSTIGLPFADDFFAALRACFNARATDLAFERLTFVLLGVATPDQLIQDPVRTPFNIGKRIDLTDFSLDEAQGLAPGLHPDAGEAGRRLERVLHWTGGHPYLTQALCRAVRERGGGGAAGEVVDPQVEELFLTSRAQREETNLKHARARLERGGAEGRKLLKLYRRVRQGKLVWDQPTSPLFAQLKLVGVVGATDEGRLAVRNRIYEAVFTPRWAKSAMPADRGRQLAATALLFVLIWFVGIQPRFSEQSLRAAIEDDGYNSAIQAYRILRASPFYRSRATELMQEFWERRALKYALAGERDESILCYLQGLSLRDDKRFRVRAANLVGLDYKSLLLTLRHEEEVRDVAFGGGGKVLLSMASNGRAGFWDTRTGMPLSTPLKIEEGAYIQVFSPDGRTLADSPLNGTVRIWDSNTGKEVVSPLQQDDLVIALAFSRDGKTLATGSLGAASEEPVALLWDVRSGKPLDALVKHKDSINALAFSPDGLTLATASGNIFNNLPVVRRFFEESIEDEKKKGPSGDSSLLELLLGHLDLRARKSDKGSTTRLWDLRTGEPHNSLLQDEGHVWDLAFSPTGEILATGSVALTSEGLIGGTVRLWNTYSGRPITPSLYPWGGVFSMAFSPDGQTLATGGAGRAVQFWDTRTGNPLVPPLRHESVWSLAFSPDGLMFATGGDDHTIRLWDTNLGKPIAQSFQHQGMSALALSSDGRTLAIASRDGVVALLDARTGASLTPPLLHREQVGAIAFSPNGQTLVTASADQVTHFWDTHTGAQLPRVLVHPRSVEVAAFSPDGRILAVAAGEFTILWDVRSGKSPLPTLIRDLSRSRPSVPMGEFLPLRLESLPFFGMYGQEKVPCLPCGMKRLSLL